MVPQGRAELKSVGPIGYFCQMVKKLDKQKKVTFNDFIV